MSASPGVTAVRGRSKLVAVPGSKFITTVCPSELFLTSKNWSWRLQFAGAMAVAAGMVLTFVIAAETVFRFRTLSLAV